MNFTKERLDDTLSCIRPKNRLANMPCPGCGETGVTYVVRNVLHADGHRVDYRCDQDGCLCRWSLLWTTGENYWKPQIVETPAHATATQEVSLEAFISAVLGPVFD
jgi:predicted RNA-binding Zn-ribbon protein involved in translation (DUF1610 family)